MQQQPQFNNSFNTIAGRPSKHRSGSKNSLMVDYGNGTIANYGRKQQQRYPYSAGDELCEFQVTINHQD